MTISVANNQLISKQLISKRKKQKEKANVPKTRQKLVKNWLKKPQP